MKTLLCFNVKKKEYTRKRNSTKATRRESSRFQFLDAQINKPYVDVHSVEYGLIVVRLACLYSMACTRNGYCKKPLNFPEFFGNSGMLYLKKASRGLQFILIMICNMNYKTSTTFYSIKDYLTQLLFYFEDYTYIINIYCFLELGAHTLQKI